MTDYSSCRGSISPISASRPPKAWSTRSSSRRARHRLRDCPVGRARAGQRLQRPGGAGHEGCRPGRWRPTEALSARDAGRAHRADLDRPWPGARAVEQHARLGERPRHAHPGRDRVGSRGPPAHHARRRPRHRIGGAAGAGGCLSAAGARAPAAATRRAFRCCSARRRRWTSASRSWRWCRRGAAGRACPSSASSTTGARSSPRGRARTCAATGARHPPSWPARGSPSSDSGTGHDRLARRRDARSCSASTSRSFPTGSRSFGRISPRSAPFAPRRRPRSRRISTVWRARAARTAFPRSASSRARWSSGWRPSRPRARRLASTRRWTGWRRCSDRRRPSWAARREPAGTPLRATHHPAASPETDRLVADAAGRGLRRAAGRSARRSGRAARRRAARPARRRDAAAGEGDPSAVASAWTASRAARARSCWSRRCARWTGFARHRIRRGRGRRRRAGAAGLPRYARTLARSARRLRPCSGRGARCRARGRGSTACLEEANIRVVRCALAQAVQELLDREVPDLMLLATRLPDGDGATVARIVREDPRFRMMPIVFVGPDDVPRPGGGPPGRRGRLPADRHPMPSCCCRPSSCAPSAGAGCAS